MAEKDDFVNELKEFMEPELSKRFNVELSEKHRMKLNKIKSKLDIATDADWLRGVIDWTFSRMFDTVKPQD